MIDIHYEIFFQVKLDFLELSQCNISGFIFPIANNLPQSQLYFSPVFTAKKQFNLTLSSG